jgi:tyrosinase
MGVPVRKNQNKLTSSERTAFVNAVLQLKRQGGYDTLVQIHGDRMMADYAGGPPVGHDGPSFLAWHREYLLQFERALQAINPKVTVPYWDWTLDRSKTSSLWGAGFLGGDGRSGDAQVTTGPFAYATGNWTLNVRLDDRPYLTRAMGVSATALPTRSELTDVLARTPYDAAPWNADAPGGFRNGIEGFGSSSPMTHNQVHVWVGGHMLTSVSPNDPVFFLHHCFIDKCWADWCAAHPGLPAYAPGGGTDNVIDVDERMPPWGDMAPGDLQAYTRYYTYA